MNRLLSSLICLRLWSNLIIKACVQTLLLNIHSWLEVPILRPQTTCQLFSRRINRLLTSSHGSWERFILPFLTTRWLLKGGKIVDEVHWLELIARMLTLLNIFILLFRLIPFYSYLLEFITLLFIFEANVCSFNFEGILDLFHYKHNQWLWGQTRFVSLLD